MAYGRHDGFGLLAAVTSVFCAGGCNRGACCPVASDRCVARGRTGRFFDGFGGGRDRESILRIMKDSYIGSYGVIGLIMYYLLGVGSLISLPAPVLPVVLLCADPFSKFVCGHIIGVLPYARREEESKAKVVYVRFNWKETLVSAVGGLLPLLLLPVAYGWILTGPCMVFFLLIRLFHCRLKGYTGDCCGALFLLAELSAWMMAAIVVRLNG